MPLGAPPVTPPKPPTKQGGQKGGGTIPTRITPSITPGALPPLVPNSPANPTQLPTLGPPTPTPAQDQANATQAYWDAIFNQNETQRDIALLELQQQGRGGGGGPDNSLAYLNEASYRHGLDIQQNQGNRNNIFDKRRFLDTQYGLDQGFIKQTWGLSDDQFNLDQGFIQSSQQINTQQRGLQGQNIDLQERANRQSAYSDSTARGATLSQGTGDTLANIAQDATINRGLNAIGLAADNLGFKYKLDSGVVKHDTDNLGFQYKLDTSTNKYEGDVAELDHALANNALAGQALDSIARDYGMKIDDLKISLAKAAGRHGIKLEQAMARVNAMFDSNIPVIQAQATQAIVALISGPQ